MDFPQYRKRFDAKSFYKIINNRNFQEVQLVGEKKFIHEINANKYFEIILIQEMLALKGEIYQVSNENEWNSVNNK